MNICILLVNNLNRKNNFRITSYPAVQKIIDKHIHVWNFDKAAYAWLDANTSIRTEHNIEEIE
ncbi:MAG: hypothetical protein IPO01_15560 [Chitinophagaceae bacterium]|nr:hypothetical protein [Chitinophagaceae bacterium]